MLKPFIITCISVCAVYVTCAKSQTTYTETVLHSFEDPLAPQGSGPSTTLLFDTAGNIYGGASSGGTWGAGAIFRLSPSGTQTVIHSFGGSTEGASPIGTLALDEAGNLYGTTLNGGTACDVSGGCGVFFVIDTSGKESVLHAFTDEDDGGFPYSGVVRDAAGNFYGTTAFGGKGGNGTVFKFDAAGNETVLHNFAGGSDGSLPDTGLTIHSGYIYGTTECGGTGSFSGCVGGAGTIFRLDAAGQETILYNFTGGADGAYPQSGVIFDEAGNIYGTTSGSSGITGVLYMLSPAGQLAILHTFTGGSDGGAPSGNLFRDSAGNLYGTTFNGGKGDGTIFRIDAAGNYSVFHRFTGMPDGSGPSGGLIAGPSGSLYGTTYKGGTWNGGTIFQLDAAGGVTIVYSFPSEPDGTVPLAGLVMDASANLYGTTSEGGGKEDGVLFKIDPSGNYSILYDFDGTYGSTPEAPLTLDSQGNLYGTAHFGGASGYGTVFEFNSAGEISVLHNFTGGTDGARPEAGVTFDSAGNLYGTTSIGGGKNGFGTVYKLAPNGNITALHEFLGEPDGAAPTAGITFDSAGNLYGTANQGGDIGCYPREGCGIVYKIGTSGTYAILHTFTGGPDGGGPYGNVILDSAGNLYGTTYQGGTYGYGVIYKIDPSGNESVLYTFLGESDGGNPLCGLLLDNNGNLFGTTASAGIPTGPNGPGVVFELDANGNYLVLYNFTGAPDGSTPYGSLVMDSTGDLYGTTSRGGYLTTGTIFKLSRQ